MQGGLCRGWCGMSRMTEQEAAAYLHRFQMKRKGQEQPSKPARELIPSTPPTGGMSKLEADMQRILENADLPKFEQQHEPFKHLGRKHKLDFAWIPQKVVLEVNGGVHSVKRQMTADTEKLFLLQREGWFVIVATKQDVENGTAVARVRDALEMRGQM